ncbi:MAG: hypothetical protein I4O51_03165 [Flavobacterium micromati]|nr:hypothetical protein [Flavobacterium micromati]
MTIQLLEGEFDANDAVELITKMIEVKIKFHESKISKSQQEEDIKSRENKIKALQNSLYDARTFLNSKNDSVNINSSLKIE